VPLPGHPGEAVLRRLEALDRAGPDGRHVDEEGTGERGLGRQEPQVSGDARAQRRFGAQVGGLLTARSGRAVSVHRNEPPEKVVQALH
jgi:hypothetical protein